MHFRIQVRDRNGERTWHTNHCAIDIEIWDGQQYIEALAVAMVEDERPLLAVWRGQSIDDEDPMHLIEGELREEHPHA